MSLNVFILHALGQDFSQLPTTRKTIINHLFCFEKYAPNNRYYYHDVNEPSTKALRDIRFHVVIFDTTALWMRWRRPRKRFSRIKEKLAFIADWDAVKIAIPQDDYDHSELLDDWLAEYRFDTVFTSVWNHRALLYRRMSARGAVLPTLTGFVDDNDIDAARGLAKPFRDRPIDIGYRATFLPARFGIHGQLKGLLAERMQRATDGHGLATDISTDDNAVLLGGDWMTFLGNSKFCLASESGSSLWDPHGEIMDRTEAYERENPGASFSEIEAACFPGEDRRWMFTAVSPRIFEAALLKCGQILVEGTYLDRMEPWRHYLPIDEHCESASEVIARMRDVAAMEKMIEACHSAVIDSPEYRYSTHVTNVLNHVADLVARKRIQGTPEAKYESLMARHQSALPVERLRRRPPVARIRWMLARLRSRLAAR